MDHQNRAGHHLRPAVVRIGQVVHRMATDFRDHQDHQDHRQTVMGWPMEFLTLQAVDLQMEMLARVNQLGYLIPPNWLGVLHRQVVKDLSDLGTYIHLVPKAILNNLISFYIHICVKI